MLSMEEKQLRARADQFSVTDRIRAWAREAEEHLRRARAAVPRVVRALEGRDNDEAGRALRQVERAVELLDKAARMTGDRMGRATQLPGVIADEARGHQVTILKALKLAKERRTAARMRVQRAGGR